MNGITYLKYNNWLKVESKKFHVVFDFIRVYNTNTNGKYRFIH